MANSLSPAFVKINYVSRFGPHVMTLPTVPIEPTTVGGSIYQFILRGAALPVACEGAIEDFIDVIKQWFRTTTTFVDYTIYAQDDPGDPPHPVQSGALDVAGTISAGGWDKASQVTWTWRTDEFGLFKLVFLDAPTGDNWNKVTSVGTSGPYFDVDEYVTADVTWLAGRDGGRPDVFLQQSLALNEKLRRAYRMN